MKVSRTSLEGVLLLEPEVHRDHRGFLLETYHRQTFFDAGVRETFVQDIHSSSIRATLRGLHTQSRKPQGKLVRVIEGEIFDVAVDVRVGSATFGRWIGQRLSAGNVRQLYIPPGFAHGFCVLSEQAQVTYKCTRLYDPEDELVIAWNDPELAIDWPVSDPVLSRRDRLAPRLSELTERLPHCDSQ